MTYFKPIRKGSMHTYEKACAVVRKMGINTPREYRQRYKENGRLPAAPNVYYKKEWSTWSSFFGRKKRNLYKTLAQASRKARALGIRSQPEYRRRYKEADGRLPADPNTKYTYADEWISWPVFLGTNR